LGVGTEANGNLDQQLAEAEQRLADARKETRIAKIERVLGQHEDDKAESANNDDREKFGSVGNQSQATTQHPMGDNNLVPVPTREQYEVMKREHEGAQNRRFFDREAKLMRAMKVQIEQRESEDNPLTNVLREAEYLAERMRKDRERGERYRQSYAGTDLGDFFTRERKMMGDMKRAIDSAMKVRWR
jgi:hypothetical protein